MTSSCSHPVVYQGMCAACGADVGAAALSSALAQGSSDAAAAARAASAAGGQAIVLGSAHKTITLSASALAERTKSNSLELMHRRRLLAVLDLDHTLLHATSDSRVERFVGREEDLFRITLGGHAGVGGKTHFVKLRPNLAPFLDSLAALFDTHVYTMGARNYADAVVALLDPEHKVIKHRIVSRDEGGAGHAANSAQAAEAAAAHTAKSLRRMYPCDEGLIAIIDDRTDVWADNAKNVVRAFEYLYFSGRGEMNSRPQQMAQQRHLNSQQQRSQSHVQEPVRSEQLEPIRSKSTPMPAVSVAKQPVATYSAVVPPAASTAVVPTPTVSSSGIRRRKTNSISTPAVAMQMKADAAAPIAAASAADPIVLDGEEEQKSSLHVLTPTVATPAAPAKSTSTPIVIDDDEPIEYISEDDMIPYTASSTVFAAARVNQTTARLVQEAIASGKPSEGLLAPGIELHQTEINRILDAFGAHPQQLPISEGSLIGRFARRFQSQIEKAPQLNNQLAKHLSSTPYAADPATLPIFPYQFCHHPFPDNVLVSLTGVLQAIHTLFYRQIDQATSAPPADEQKTNEPAGLSTLLPLNPKLSVPRLITLLKQTTLAGCVIVFSGVYPTVKNADGSPMVGAAQRADAWIQATAFGALCLEEFPGQEKARQGGDEDAIVPRFGAGFSSADGLPPRVTHVVAARDGSAKLHFAATLPVEERPHLVHVSWLWHSMAHFQRGDETLFPLWSEQKKAQANNAAASVITPTGESAVAKPVAESAAPAAAATSDATASSSTDAAAPSTAASAPADSSNATAAAPPVASSSSTPVGAGGIRRRIPKKPLTPAMPAASASDAASSSQSTSAVALGASTSSTSPAPAAHSFHLVHHVQKPPTADALVERVLARLRADEDKSRESEALYDLTLAREMVKAAELTSRRRSSIGAATVVPRSRKSVSFGGELGPTNPHFADDTHTESDVATPAFVAPKRKQMTNGALPAGTPLDDLERAHKERKFAHPRAATVAPSSSSSSRAAAAMEDVLNLSDGDDSTMERRYQEQDESDAVAESDAFADEISDDLFADEPTDGGDYEDSFQDDS